MSKSQRGDAPVVQPVPWNAGSPALPEFADQGQAQVAESKPDAVEPFAAEINVASAEKAPGWKPEPQQSVFDPKVKAKSVFAPPEKPVVKNEPIVFELHENDPTWLQLVNFCQKHGNDIIQARYPHPRGECVDTIYRGVTVFAHPTTQVRHKIHGWIDWQDAIY